MDRSVAVGNKLCAKRMQRERHERHRAKLDRIHADIDNRLPSSYSLPHLRVNLKRGQQMEDRFTEIDRENRILLKRMSDIIQKPSFAPAEQPGPCKNVSLNRDSRRKELERITNENLGILKRIERVQPMYNHVKWEHDFRRSRRFLKNTCEFPVILTGPECADTETDKHPPMLISPNSNSAPELSSDDQLVLREGRRFGDGFYLIEMYTDHKNGLVISAYSGENLYESAWTYLDSDRHAAILQTIDHDYTKLLDYIKIVVSHRGGYKLILQV